MSSPSPDLRTPLLRRQLLSTRVSAPNEELPSDQYQGRLFPGSLPRGLLHRGFFSPQGALGRLDRRALHIRTVSSNGWGHLLCQLTNVIYHLRQRLDIGASGWWKLLNFFFFFSGWLSSNLANGNVFLSCGFKGTVALCRKTWISARLSRWRNPTGQFNNR